MLKYVVRRNFVLEERKKTLTFANVANSNVRFFLSRSVLSSFQIPYRILNNRNQNRAKSFAILQTLFNAFKI